MSQKVEVSDAVIGEKPFVAIWMVTYNHERYIAQAIDSVLEQKTNFSYRLYIGEDCSSDNTRTICKSYAEKYPHLVTLICTERNNIIKNADNIYEATFNSGARYIAILEGDDYWTDKYKLQKQVDFLEENADYSVCFTNIDVLNEVGDFMPLPAPFLNFDKDTYLVEDFILSPFHKPLAIPILTMVFRNVISFPLPAPYYASPAGDTALTLLLGHHGKIRYLKEKTAVYRQHGGGRWTQGVVSAINRQDKKVASLKIDRSLFYMLDCFNEYSGRKYHKAIQRRLLPVSKELLIYGSGLLKGRERVSHILKMFRGYNKYKDRTDYKELFYYLTILFFPWPLRLYSMVFGKNSIGAETSMEKQ
jgi:glycosyltransferase involved in cell wall biosynthesis